MNASRSLAIVAALLALGAVVLRDPPTARRATVDLSALAKEVDKGADHVSADELRAMVGAGVGVARMRLVDLRPEAAFAAGHVPGAENVPLARLEALKVRRDESVILYSDGGIHSSQAWFFLRARGVQDVRFLLGGYDEWLRVTAPAPTPSTTPSTSAAPPVVAPPLASPSAAAVLPVEPPKAKPPRPTRPAAVTAKVREGC